MYKLLLFSALLLSPMAAFGAKSVSAEDAFSPARGLDLNRSFEAQRGAIIAALDDGKTYSEIGATDLQTVRESLDRISTWLGDADSVEQLPDANRVRIFNEQEKINTLLTRAHADSRLVCRREKPIGSNRPTNTCQTVAERRRMRENAVQYMGNMPKAEGEITTP